MTRLLVCGSRDWPGTWEDIATHLPEPPAVIIHGACSRTSVRGRAKCEVSVDMLADFAARGLGMTVLPFPVDHAIDGPWPAAGPRRNARMLRESAPTCGLAFGPLWFAVVCGVCGGDDGGRTECRKCNSTGRSRWKHTGTGGMVALMLAAGLPVRWIASPDAPAVDLVAMPEPPR